MYNPLLLSKSRAKWTEGDPLNGLLDKITILSSKKYDVSPVTYPAYVDTEGITKPHRFQRRKQTEQRSVNT
jgi:phage head maturation protease